MYGLLVMIRTGDAVELVQPVWAMFPGVLSLQGT